MQQFCLTFARLMLAGWIGGAALFVVTSVAEQTSDSFDAVTKNALALIRFPWYYTFGFGMLLLGLLFGLLGLAKNTVGFTRRAAFIVITASALLVMLGDLLFVFVPLWRMSAEVQAGQPYPAEFHHYHESSKNVNLVAFGLASISALLVCSPTWEPEDEAGERHW